MRIPSSVFWQERQGPRPRTPAEGQSRWMSSTRSRSRRRTSGAGAGHPTCDAEGRRRGASGVWAGARSPHRGRRARVPAEAARPAERAGDLRPQPRWQPAGPVQEPNAAGTASNVARSQNRGRQPQSQVQLAPRGGALQPRSPGACRRGRPPRPPTLARQDRPSVADQASEDDTCQHQREKNHCIASAALGTSPAPRSKGSDFF